MLSLFVRLQLWLQEERGDINLGGGLGVVGVVILVLFILWLTESSGKTNLFE